jgi:hypothetical protein
LYLPSVERRGLGEIVIAVDTSGSISKMELEQFAGEISSISEEAQPETIHVVYCDAAVQSAEEFTASEPVRLEPKGGGGTDFRPVFQWVEENDIAPACLVYLTDLCCDSFPAEPEYPVLWVTDSRRIAPFGETVRIGLEWSGHAFCWIVGQFQGPTILQMVGTSAALRVVRTSERIADGTGCFQKLCVKASRLFIPNPLATPLIR